LESQKFLGDKAYKGEAAIITSEETKNGEITETQKNKKIKNCLHPASV